MTKQRFRRSVGKQYTATGVDRDHPRCNARQNRFDKGAAGVELLIGSHQRAGLLLQSPGHPVEGGAQRCDLIFGRTDDRDPCSQIALLNPPGRIDQFFNRAQQPVGELQGGEYRQRNDDQSTGKQCAVELELVGATALQQGPIIGQHAIGARNLVPEVIARLACDEQKVTLAVGERR